MPVAPFQPADAETALTVLDALVADPLLLATIPESTRLRLLIAAGRVSRPGRDVVTASGRAHRKARKRAEVEEDRAMVDTSGLRRQRQAPVYTPLWLERLPPGTTDAADGEAPADPPRLNRARACYVCKEPYTQLHAYYDAMCTSCGDFSYRKRSQTADVTGRVALVTGGRLKIGFQCAIALLRAGARVVVTTRFPHDAARRFAAEPDLATFASRLQIHGLDLRHAPTVERFCQHLCDTLPQLDLLINNACQTVRRPPGFYQHLKPLEELDRAQLAPAERALLAEASNLHPVAAIARDGGEGADLFPPPDALFPAGRLDEDLQQVDLRTMNSWRLKLADVPTDELLEVQLVNAIAPFILNSKLKPLLLRGNTGDRHIVNVSAMEGQFYRTTKTDRHPHTNMAKAALNMLTRTSAPDYRKDGIYMNAVDTGWVTDEDPAAHVERKVEEGFQPPLDIIDGAARILDPYFVGLNTGQHTWGQFLKDYKPSPW